MVGGDLAQEIRSPSILWFEARWLKEEIFKEIVEQPKMLQPIKFKWVVLWKDMKLCMVAYINEIALC
jgi:hypothetical protein